MTIEQRLDQLEKRNKRLTVALTMTVVAMAAVVTMAATELKDGVFDSVVAKRVFVKNDVGQIVVTLDTDDNGNGLVRTFSAKGKTLVKLSSTVNGEGTVTTFQPNGKPLVKLFATADGNGGLINVLKQDGRTHRPDAC